MNIQQIYPEDFESKMNDMVDVEYAETEGIDFRVDFCGGYSLWLRGGRCVEGAAPKRLKAKLTKMCKAFGISDYIQYA